METRSRSFIGLCVEEGTWRTLKMPVPLEPGKATFGNWVFVTVTSKAETDSTRVSQEETDMAEESLGT